MDEQKEGLAPVTLFYAYAHEDEQLRDKLEKHLSLLRRQRLIADWYDRKILAGDEWAQEIDRHLEAASIILLLISPDFLASDYCYEIEMQRALERHQLGEARVIPIILRPVDWRGAPFGHLQCLPRDGKSVTEWDNQDTAFRDIAQGIRRAIRHLHLNPENSQAPSVTQTQKIPAASHVISRYKWRQHVLTTVHSYWITGNLEQSRLDTPVISLRFCERRDLVRTPWQQDLLKSDLSGPSLPAGTHITQVYDEAEGELLVLGEAGAGKTTLLLELARDLLDRAKLGETHPIPVVFNLFSWSGKRQPLSGWIVEELQIRYHVPSAIGQFWIDTNQILPLLDGLDEIATEHQKACVSAINTFRRNHEVSLVLCSRSADYLAQETPLLLNNAIVIQPLTKKQVDDYLSDARGKLTVIRTELHSSLVLQELVRTPLMLYMLTHAYRGKTVEDVKDLLAGSPSTRKHQLFVAYIKHVLKHRRSGVSYTPEQAIRWLAWLAQRMREHSRREFSLDQIHSDWLPNGNVSRMYHGIEDGRFHGAGCGIFSGGITGLSVGLGFGWVPGLLIGLLVVLLLGGIGVLQFKYNCRRANDNSMAWTGFILTLISVLIIVAPVGWASGWLAVGVTKLIVSWLTPWSIASWIRWLIGLFAGYFSGGFLLQGLINIMVSIPSVCFERSTGQDTTNIFELLGNIFRDVIKGALGGEIETGDIDRIIVYILLFLIDSLPWNYKHFLDDATQCLLLRKMGSRYIFAHHLLHDYFASLDQPIREHETGY